MKKNRLLMLAVLLVTGWSAYASLPEVVLGPGLSAGRTAYHQRWTRVLSADTAYVLTGLYYVDSTYSMTIQPGTLVFGDTASTLIISRGAQIYALGSANSPIVFTSNKPAGARAPGDWGGILILGRAAVNKVEPLIEGGIIGGTYGGTDAADNSGIFRYVRIEFAGYRFQLNNETNGLTLGGVGSGTELHHIQVSYANDDSDEWFGGTVGAKYLVAFGGVDDEFDSDFGWAGKVQFGFGLKDPNNWDPTGETNGFESDNDGSATSTEVPFTQPHFSNITLVGPERTDSLVGNLPPGNKFQYSALLRRSTRLSIYNSVLAGYPWGLRIRDINTIASATGDTLQIRNTSIAASLRPSGSSTVHDSSQWPGIAAWYNTPAYSNSGSNPRNPSAVGFTNMTSLSNPNPVPASGSELIGSASFANARLTDPFFEAVTYRGAFDPSRPMGGQWTAGWTNFDPQNTNYRSAIAKTNSILGPGLGAGRTPYHQRVNRILSADTNYILTGLYYVDSTYSLTIPAGTVVLGDTGSALIIARGAQILATGTEQKPIVFSSRRNPGQRVSGDWGGILILGRAPINKVEPLIEGGIIGGTYGGSNPNDNSGVFRYVRIEFAGYRFQLNNETNGLTMGGVGSGTEIHHVQVSYADDDSYEWFGGTVSAKYLVAYGGTDDEFDSDFGWRGRVQHAFGLRDLNRWDPTGESNGFESDNDGSATSADVPYTQPLFSNVTLVGPERTDALVGNLPPGNKFQYGVLIRRSTRLSLYNSVIAGYPWGIRLRDVNTIAAATADTLQFRSVSFTASQRPSGSSSIHDSSQWAGVTSWYNTTGYGNTGSTPRNPSAVGFTNMTDLKNPNPVPAAGSELIGSANFAYPNLAGGSFDVVSYRGAFDPTKPMSGQWTAGWTNFDPQFTNYLTSFPTSVESYTATEAVPETFTLAQNYPNPFNPTTTIRFAVPSQGAVTLKVYNVLGQEVAALVQQVMPAGVYETMFDATGLASGMYVYRLTTNSFSQTMKMMLVK
jgi:hypothetical protein